MWRYLNWAPFSTDLWLQHLKQKRIFRFVRACQIFPPSIIDHSFKMFAQCPTFTSCVCVNILFKFLSHVKILYIKLYSLVFFLPPRSIMSGHETDVHTISPEMPAMFDGMKLAAVATVLYIIVRCLNLKSTTAPPDLTYQDTPLNRFLLKSCPQLTKEWVVFLVLCLSVKTVTPNRL